MQLKESFYHKFKSPLGIIFLIIIAVGLYSYSQMKVELLPNVTFPKVKIIADNGEQPVDKMLITVTQPTGRGNQKERKPADDSINHVAWKPVRFQHFSIGTPILTWLGSKSTPGSAKAEQICLQT